MKRERIAVETLTLKELAALFRDALEIGLKRSIIPIQKAFNDLKRANISSHQWIKSYEIFKGTKLNFYCAKKVGIKSPVISAGMSYRTNRGMVLVVVDTNNGSLGELEHFFSHGGREFWDGWVLIYTSHFCERFAERILKSPEQTFNVGARGIMFGDMIGEYRIEREKFYLDVDEVTYRFGEGEAYGYRDRKNKVTLFRTVYSNDMLPDQRLALNREWKTSDQEISELFYMK